MNGMLPKHKHRLWAWAGSRELHIQTGMRIAAAVIGGYALTVSTLAAGAAWLPWPKLDLLFGTAFLAPLVYLAAVLWAFLAPTAGRAWQGLAGVIIPCCLLVWLAGR